MVMRVDKLTGEQRAKMDAWADQWIEVGLRLGAADRPKFEGAAKRCYEAAGIPWHGNVIWVSSPLVMAIAAPVAAFVIELNKRKQVRGAVGGAVRGAVSGAVDDAVSGAVSGAVDDAVSDAVGGAVDGAVHGAVHGAVGGAVGGAVRGAVDDAVSGAVGGAVGGAVRDAVRDAVGDAVGGAEDQAIRKAVSQVISNGWYKYVGGQFWVGGWFWSGAYTSFFREICNLELAGDLWERGKAYEATMESACWWYPHRDFIMVCERPSIIERELTNPEQPRGWGSHRLHREDGPAVAWADWFGVYAVHGVQIPFSKRYIVDQPDLITVEAIDKEENAEIRRVMINRFGMARYLTESGSIVVHELPESYSLKGLRKARLLRRDQRDDEPIVAIECHNSTPEPDGSIKIYHLRVDPNAYGGRASTDCLAAMASTWRNEDGSLFFKRPEDYAPEIET